MDAIRARIGSAFEWVIAAVFLVATIYVSALILQELRTTPSLPPPLANAVMQDTATPAAVPPRAISVPLVLLFDGREVRIGDTIAAVAALLGRDAETGVEQLDHGPAGDRITRFYEHAGRRFILVFERAPRPVESKVAAIYIQ